MVVWKDIKIMIGVALFTRAWIEMPDYDNLISSDYGRPLYEGVD